MLRHDVIRAIVQRDRAKTGLTEDVVKRDAKTLYEAACEQFGTWETALQYAGVGTRRLRAASGCRVDEIIETIRRLCLFGYNLSARHNRRRDHRLYAAALRHFGTWREALLAAGIDPAHVRLRSQVRQISKQKIIRVLQRRHRAELSLVWSDVCLENRVVAQAARRVFGGWGKALAAAGIEMQRQRTPRRRKWDRGQIIAEIQDRHRQGKSLTRKAVEKDFAALLYAAGRYFGKWRTALEAAGLAGEDRAQRERENEQP